MDGSLTLTTYVDDSGIDEGMKEIEGKAGKATSVFGKIFAKIGRYGSGLLKTIGMIGSRVIKLIGAIGGIGLAFSAIIGIVAVLGGAISRAFQSEEVKADMEYIKFVLGQAIQPLVDAIAKIIVKIIGWVIKLLGFINAISIALFNYNLFISASVDNFKKANKQAEKMKKTLAGFDEMNVLSDNSGGTDSGSGGLSPDLPDLAGETQKSLQWLEELKNKIIEIKNAFLEFFTDWGQFLLGISQLKDGIITMFEGLKLEVLGIWDIIVGIFTLDIDKIKEGFGKFAEGAGKIFTGLWTVVQGVFNTIVGFIRGVLSPIVNWIRDKIITPIVNKFNELKDKISKPFKDGVDKIKGFFNNLPTWFNTTLTKIKTKFGEIGGKVGDAIGNAFKKAINAVLRTIENVLNTPIRGINKILTTVNKLPGVNINKIQTISLPRLAKGGIINLPNHGVNLGGAIGGESGREGVIPLTDSQQMQLLGEAIGRYITINANITNSMNGRILSRELQRVQNESSFATNGR